MNTRSLLLLFALPLFAAAPKPADAAAVAAAEKAWADASIKGDSAALAKLLGDDLAYTHSSAKTETKADVIKSAAAGGTVAIDFNDTQMRQYGSVIVATHKAAIKNKQGAVANLYLTHVWAKQGGGWQLVSRQATRLP